MGRNAINGLDVCLDVRGLVGHEPPALKPMTQPINEILGSRWGPVLFGRVIFCSLA